MMLYFVAKEATIDKSRIKLLVALCSFALVDGATRPAFGAIQTFNAAYGSISSPLPADDLSVDLSLPQFDSSLGNLTGITITLRETLMLQSLVLNTGNAATFSAATASGTFNVSGPEGLTSGIYLATPVFAPGGQGIAAGSLSSPAVVYGPTASSDAIASQGAAISDFSFFEAPGGGTVSEAVSGSFDGSYSGNGPSRVFFGGNATVYGSLEIEYIYSAIPEPAAWWAIGSMGTALCCCRFTSRSRR